MWLRPSTPRCLWPGAGFSWGPAVAGLLSSSVGVGCCHCSMLCRVPGADNVPITNPGPRTPPWVCVRTKGSATPLPGARPLATEVSVAEKAHSGSSPSCPLGTETRRKQGHWGRTPQVTARHGRRRHPGPRTSSCASLAPAWRPGEQSAASGRLRPARPVSCLPLAPKRTHASQRGICGSPG